MDHRNRILCFFFVVLLIVICSPSFGQVLASSKDDVRVGTVWFKGKRTKLAKEAKAALDTLIKKIQSNPTMQVLAVSFNKDFCDKCSKLSWKRTTVIFKYLSKHGVVENRLISTNRLVGESNKVDIYLTASIDNRPHPGIKR